MGAGGGANNCDLALLPSLLWALASPLGSEYSGPPGGMPSTHPTLCRQYRAHRCGLCRTLRFTDSTTCPPVAAERAANWQCPCWGRGLHVAWKFLEGGVCISTAWWIAVFLFLKAGMHVGNTCLTKIYNCSPSCLRRLQNWVMLFTRSIP